MPRGIVTHIKDSSYKNEAVNQTVNKKRYAKKELNNPDNVGTASNSLAAAIHKPESQRRCFDGTQQIRGSEYSLISSSTVTRTASNVEAGNGSSSKNKALADSSLKNERKQHHKVQFGIATEATLPHSPPPSPISGPLPIPPTLTFNRVTTRSAENVDNDDFQRPPPLIQFTDATDEAESYNVNDSDNEDDGLGM